MFTNWEYTLWNFTLFIDDKNTPNAITDVVIKEVTTKLSFEKDLLKIFLSIPTKIKVMKTDKSKASMVNILEVWYLAPERLKYRETTMIAPWRMA